MHNSQEMKNICLLLSIRNITYYPESVRTIVAKQEINKSGQNKTQTELKYDTRNK